MIKNSFGCFFIIRIRILRTNPFNGLRSNILPIDSNIQRSIHIRWFCCKCHLDTSIPIRYTGKFKRIALRISQRIIIRVIQLPPGTRPRISIIFMQGKSIKSLDSICIATVCTVLYRKLSRSFVTFRQEIIGIIRIEILYAPERITVLLPVQSPTGIKKHPVSTTV